MHANGCHQRGGTHMKWTFFVCMMTKVSRGGDSCHCVIPAQAIHIKFLFCLAINFPFNRMCIRNAAQY